MALTFKFQKWREKKAQHFDKDNITLTKAGITYNVYDKIQEAREDTEIMATLIKYGCIEGHIKVDAGKLYDDFTKYSDLRGVLEQKKAAENMFYNLPLDVRQSFNNNIDDFTKNGKEWLQNRIKEKDKRFVNAESIAKDTTNMAQSVDSAASTNTTNVTQEVNQ